MAVAPLESVTVKINWYFPAYGGSWTDGVAVVPPGIPTAGYPGAMVHRYESGPGLELVDADASKLTLLDETWKVFVADVAPPGPVITIVIPLG